jgi:hypothetical protein
MQILKSKTIAIVVAIFLMISMTSSTILLPNANAHTPAQQFPTWTYVSVAPNPIGVGQLLYVNIWVGLPPPNAVGILR